ncbi:MAG: hypothetical protein Kow0037_28900 [Calditrichia bacterium]
MSNKKVFLGQTPLLCDSKPIQGEVVERFGEKFYKISNFDEMPPFFMNIVSDSDIWMFASSNGALTAGRRNPDNALFPYYTDDKIHDSEGITGSKTILWVQRGRKHFLWEPLSGKCDGIYLSQRFIYKNILGNQLIFEEINYDLGLCFSYAWHNSGKLGIIKKSRLTNLDIAPVNVMLLDGMQNILPPGVSRRFQNEYSTLADGYKKNELVPGSSLALYTLSSLPTDKAEPNEALRATTVWSEGLPSPEILLSNKQLREFRRQGRVHSEMETKGERGAYFVCSELELPGNGAADWYMVADLNQDHCAVVGLLQMLQQEKDLGSLIEKEISISTEILKKLVAGSDGYQVTADIANDFRHCSNMVFNILRGGIPARNYQVDRDDFRSYLENTHLEVARKYAQQISQLPQTIEMWQLEEFGEAGDRDYQKLCLEYLPLTFGRRHGDPSRPWNSFSIDIRDEQGRRIYNYQGNWRDIFQNWEALAISYPEFIEGMIAKFVNASTADGYNPYRVFKNGFEWEELDPADEWSNIGYWGDHQIIYLLKLLEMSVRYHPGKVEQWLHQSIFTYANIPYRIKPYEQLIQDPHDTIEFDFELHKSLLEKEAKMGSSAKLVTGRDGKIFYVNLAEKLLVPLLVKLSNFVPEAGIWMNTQRPEWNDANNALVGYGASMVTLYYLRRYLAFCRELFKKLGEQQVSLSKEVGIFFKKLEDGLRSHQQLLEGPVSDRLRKSLLDALGSAGSEYRLNFYENGFSGENEAFSAGQIADFMELAMQFVDQSIRANKRSDNLYHSYNLIKFNGEEGIAVRRMYEMLEGQVAVLSSGYLSAAETVELLKALRNSALYREDQHSYILYPNRKLPAFLEKNRIPAGLLEKSKLLKKFIEKGDSRIVSRDANGDYHFNSRMANAGILAAELEKIGDEYPALSRDEKQLILDIYETVFDHQSFTGRSGTFYKYEGLGSIYWHMVSKLLLAVQENYYRALDAREDPDVLDELRAIYYDIREGIGVHKSPQLYGAFPTDAYSHTPWGSGAQQPGMTGQVKEDIISRFAELGVRVRNGKLCFEPALMKLEEFLKKQENFEYYTIAGEKRQLSLQPGMLAFTLCQVPVVYVRGKVPRIIVTLSDGSEQSFNERMLPEDISRSLFRRDGKIEKITVFFL